MWWGLVLLTKLQRTAGGVQGSLAQRGTDPLLAQSATNSTAFNRPSMHTAGYS